MNRNPALIIGCWSFYLLLVGGTFAAALSWFHQAFLHALHTVLFLIAGYGLSRRKSPLLLRSPGALATFRIALLLLDDLLRAVAGQSWNSREHFATALSLAMLFFILLNWIGDEAVIARAGVSAGGLVVIIGIFASYSKGYRELALPLGSRVLMAGLLTLLLPIAAGLVYQARNRFERTVWTNAGLVLVLGAIRTRSVIALCIVPLMLFAVFAIRVKPKWRRALAGVALVVFAIGFLLLANRYEPFSRLKSMLNFGTDATLSLENRLRYWSGAVPAIKEKP